MPRFYLVFVLFITLFSLWVAGLLWFINQLPRQTAETSTPVDAIVILTGGSERIGYAIELLRQDLANELFISGVGKDASITSIIEQNKSINANSDDTELLSRITLGYEAEDTKGNATESTKWLKERSYKNIRLVTANYHLPRSMLEFQSVFPNLNIIPTPVISSNVVLEDWWKFPGTRSLLISEYHKFIASYLRSLL